jgi:hypothetical protein
MEGTMETQTSIYMVAAYLTYLVLSVGMTVWVARTLYRNGAVFLLETFLGKERLAEAVNHLLVVGFYLINVGYVTLALRTAERVYTLQSLIEVVSEKLGYVLVVLGGMHFLNLYIFSRLQRAGTRRNAPPPVAPQTVIPVARAAHGG